MQKKFYSVKSNGQVDFTCQGKELQESIEALSRELREQARQVIQVTNSPENLKVLHLWVRELFLVQYIGLEKEKYLVKGSRLTAFVNAVVFYDYNILKEHLRNEKKKNSLLYKLFSRA